MGHEAVQRIKTLEVVREIYGRECKQRERERDVRN